MQATKEAVVVEVVRVVVPKLCALFRWHVSIASRVLTSKLSLHHPSTIVKPYKKPGVGNDYYAHTI